MSARRDRISTLERVVLLDLSLVPVGAWRTWKDARLRRAAASLVKVGYAERAPTEDGWVYRIARGQPANAIDHAGHDAR